MVKAFIQGISPHRFEQQGVPGHESSRFERQGVPGPEPSRFYAYATDFTCVYLHTTSTNAYMYI